MIDSMSAAGRVLEHLGLFTNRGLERAVGYVTLVVSHGV